MHQGARLQMCAMAAAIAMLFGSAVRADTIHLGAVERTDVVISTLREGMVEFTVAGRRVSPVPAERITRLVIDSEPLFNQADLAFAQGQWEQAALGYEQALQSTPRSWLKAWILPRLLQAADRTPRFDLAATAFAQLLRLSPLQAMRLRPAPPAQASPTVLATAAAELSKVAGDVHLRPLPKQAALVLLLGVRQAQGDLAEANRLGEQLLRGVLDPHDPATVHLSAALQIALAQLAIAQRDYARAIQHINANRELFTEAASQVEALLVLAEAQDGQVQAAAPREIIQDVALAYMRVVAAGRSLGDNRHVVRALLRVAALQEQLGNAAAAEGIYGELAVNYPQVPAAATAAREQARLRQAADGQ